MLAPLRLAWLSWLLLAWVCLATPAHAWVERAIKSDSVTLDVERDGTAVVTHEILLGVRGGPLSEISVEPVDADAELLEGATVTLAQHGHAAGLPLPLTATKDGARVVLHVVGIKGVRTGSHLFRFAYRTNLATAGRIQATSPRATLEWQGPSFGDGIDSARLVFRIPRSETPPRLGTGEGGDDAEGVSDEHGGVFLGTSRRAADKDELEVVRPHVARGEIVTWRVVADAAAFDVSRAALPAEAAAPLQVQAPRGARKRALLSTPASLVVVALAALLAATIVWKSRLVAEGCVRRRGRPRPLLPLSTPLRAGLAASFGLGAVALVVSGAPPILAAASLLVTLAASTHLPPRVASPLRGPGQWVRLEPDVAFDAELDPAPVRGRFFDVGTVPGFVLFLSLLGGFVAAAITILRTSTYLGLWVALASSVLFPIFCTGRAGDLPPDPAISPRALLDWLSSVLAKDASIEAHPIGRVPLGGKTHDELRLLVMPKKPLTGLVAVEVGVDFHQGALGPLPLPFVIVRVVEGSTAAAALPVGLFWSRGRAADERVAVLRPRLPTRRLTARLTLDLVASLSATKSAFRGQKAAPTSASRSGGKAQSTAKPGTTSSPVHAT